MKIKIPLVLTIGVPTSEDEASYYAKAESLDVEALVAATLEFLGSDELDMDLGGWQVDGLVDQDGDGVDVTGVDASITGAYTVEGQA